MSDLKAPWVNSNGYPDIPPDTKIDVDFSWGDCNYDGWPVSHWDEHDFIDSITMWRYHDIGDAQGRGYLPPYCKNAFKK